jgi:hypothetical protein
MKRRIVDGMSEEKVVHKASNNETGCKTAICGSVKPEEYLVGIPYNEEDITCPKCRAMMLANGKKLLRELNK